LVQGHAIFLCEALIDVGSFNGYVALLMLSPSSADRPDSAPKSGFG
jgi:hypothetical protein